MNHRDRVGLVRTGLLAGVSAIAFAASGVSAWAESLTDALVATYSSNPTIQAARAELRATDENVAQALSGWRPSLSADGTVEYSNTDTRFNSGAGFDSLSSRDDRTTSSAVVSLQQNIYRGGRTVASTNRAKSEVSAGRAQLLSTEQQVLLDAVTAYVDVLRDTATVELNANNVAVLERQLQASLDRFDVGEITRTDVAQSEARLSRARSQLTRAEADLANSRAFYERVIGMAPGTLELPDLPLLPESEEQALDIALRNNPSLLAARYNEEAARHAIRDAKGALLPSLVVQGEYGYVDEPSSGVDHTNSGSVAGRLTVPLYQSGAVFSQVRQAKQLNSQARLQIAEAARQVQENAASAWKSYLAATANIESDREQVRANEIALEGVQQEAQVGARTTLDVLNAEQELLDSRVLLVTSQRDAYVAAYSLLAVIGNLTAERLGLPVELYEPAENYENVSDKWIGFAIADEPDGVAPESGTNAPADLASK